MDLYLEFLPKLLVVGGFFIAIIMFVQGFYPIVPFQWVGWGNKNRTSKFDVKDWQGREYYRLCDAAALWAELPPHRPDDPYGHASFRFLALRLDARHGDLECENPDDVQWETPISADALRDYASKRGQMPEFLK